MSAPWRTSTSGLAYYRKLHFMKLRDLLFFYQVQCRRGWWNLRERGVPWGVQEKILGVKEGSPKHFFKFCLDGICNDANSLPEYQKPAFLTSRKVRFSLGNMPPAPYFIVHQKAILPHQNAKFACHHINKPIKNNMAVLKWYTIQCSKYFVRLLFFGAPKVSLAPSRFFFFTTSAYTGQCLFSAYGNSKRVAVIFHFFFILSPCLYSFFLFFFLGGGGGEGFHN